MGKAVFHVVIFVLMVFMISCKAKRPAIGADANACSANCNSGTLDGNVACIDRCHCFHESGQSIDKCNAEYDEAIRTQ